MVIAYLEDLTVPKLPNPPPLKDLRNTAPHIEVLSKGTELWRVYFRGGPYPTSWNAFRSYGPLGARFDHHTDPSREQERKILYAAAKGEVCFAEVFQRTRTINRKRRDPWLVGFELSTDVELLDLTGLWPTVAGASMAINTGPHSFARRWSKVIYEAYDGVAGLGYASSMAGNRPAVALYERAEHCLTIRPFFHRALADPALLAILQNVAQRLNYRLI